MSDLVPATAQPLEPSRPMQSGPRPPFLQQVKNFTAQPAVRRTLPFAGAVGVLGAAALAWTVLSPAPQRTLYSELSDSEKGAVTEALDKAAIPYQLDSATGALTVGEDDLYRARMMVASDGAVAAPTSGTDLIDNMPIGASRVVEAERLKAARERELEMTIKEIEGVESVRVHLAEAEKSVFVRDSSPPRASVMLKLARGRQLAEGQVSAIINLVSGSVPGLSADDIKLIDQHGRLLSDKTLRGGGDDRIEMQTRLEEKMRTQVAQLLTPMFGEGNFSTEVQVELDMDSVTSARESWNKDGTVRTESTQTAQGGDAMAAGYGVPGATSNTPPPPTQVVQGAPQGNTPAGAPAQAAAAGATPAPAALPTDQSATRTYEIGREVAVSNGTPGNIRRVSVAVVLSKKAKASAKPAEIAQIKSLVSAAVGANAQRGDQVEVIARNFQEEEAVPTPFYEEPWFAMVVRNAVALIVALLVIFLGLRPAIAAIRRKSEPAAETAAGTGEGPRAAIPPTPLNERLGQMPLSDQVGLAQRYINERPDSAVAAIRQMLGDESKVNA